MRVLPDWFSEVEEELKRTIYSIASKKNLKMHFVLDSKTIEKGISEISMALVNIYENAPGEYNEEQLKEIKKLKRMARKSKGKKIFGITNKNRGERNATKTSRNKKN